MDHQDFIKKLSKYKEHITTAREWDKFRKGKKLPSSNTLIRKFKSWNNLKAALKIGKSFRTYTKSELIDLAKANSQHFTTIKDWDIYSKKKALPTSHYFISNFGSWSNVKNILNINPSKRKSKYNKEVIKKLILENRDFLDSRTKWDQFSKENKLPPYITLKKYFSWQEIKKMAGRPLKYNYSEQDLQRIAREHISHFTSMNKWDDYAKKNNLPLAITYSRRFGSWRMAKVRCLY